MNDENHSLVVFVDNDSSTSCVLLRSANKEEAKQMFGRMLASSATPTLKHYCADEFVASFIAANKTKPYEMLFVGEYDEIEAEVEEIGLVYEVSCTTGQSLVVLPVDTNGDVDVAEAWEFQPTQIH